MRQQFNIGMIGYRFMGKAHSNAFQRLNMFFDTGCDIRLKALCGRDEAAVRAAAGKYGWETCETSWEKIVEREDIDIVDIGAPSNVHKEIAVLAAKNGKSIFCEKPLAINTRDAGEMLDAVNNYHVKHMVGFNYRFAPAVALAKQLIGQGKIGKIHHFRALHLQDWLLDPNYPFVWRLDKNIAGSGALGDLGAHVIDLARYLVGEFTSVTGYSKTIIKERRFAGNAAAGQGTVTVDDVTLFLAEMEGGVTAAFETSRFGCGHKNGLSFEINGSKGSIRFDLERMNELEFYSCEDEMYMRGFRKILVTEPEHPYAAAYWPAGHILGYEHTLVNEFYELITSLANDKNPLPDFYDGLKCSQVMDAVELSASERRWVDIK